ncbi:hypothetical protein [Vibrio phage PG216]|uniref:Uncharacterized protein n=1 Tax=Vibrio phage V09 TaxID=2724327 RepID=A0A6H0X9D9_9CAUD|nr:hypothetical protein COHAPHLL_00176 [Vibrio phage V09]WOL24906.1 hypothetical protein [Vibrio phage PG216]
MTREEMMSCMTQGCLKLERDGCQYHGTLCKHYLPVLEKNREEMRKNERCVDTLTFFDLNQNEWVTITC